jgi:hypothetical protein
LADKANIDRYHEERISRMTLIDMARPFHPERPRIDMSDMADAELVKKMVDKVFSDSAVDELVEREPTGNA